ncbi:hypothetical protein MTBPR1_80161 [Candidatus Terasakiella magnetica]|uniref:Uncharacterized protein n=1 Tax=Candidatus Terasakiella magnetica TaxID=1867952 RepID=A0A1C3RLG7_9PROT|nr:hypothetical protein [Candidatus Terasakiella magnetica]SCA58107.1 hypothetical protein MTBPR1_80161 [Candidatus Terasakiella magnetica]
MQFNTFKIWSTEDQFSEFVMTADHCIDSDGSWSDDWCVAQMDSRFPHKKWDRGNISWDCIDTWEEDDE